MFARDDLCGGHALIFGLVGQHRTFDHIADCVDAGDTCLPMRVCFDLTTLCHLHAQCVQSQPLGIGFAPCGNQNNIRVQCMFAVVLAAFIGHFCLGFHRLNRLHGCAHDKIQSLFFQGALECFLDFCVHARCNRI